MRQLVLFSSLSSACLVLALAPHVAAQSPSAGAAGDDELDFEGTAEVEAPPRDVTKRSVENQVVQHMPGTRGDALRAIEIMPGVARTSLGQGDPILRGAAAGESQVFLDGIPVPFMFHFGGLTSFMSSRLVEKLDVYPGNFSARYGRAVGGVIDITARDPNTDRLHAVLDLSLIDSSAFVEAPITNDLTAALAVRRSNIDFVFENFVPDNTYNVVAAPTYFDYQALASYRINSATRVRLLGYGSRDALQLFFANANDEDPGLLAMGLWASWSTLGCDESLKSVELVAEPRVLGARVEVLGDAARAAPAPGETATVSFLVAAPELSPSLGFALAACSAAPHEGGRSGCAAAPFAAVSSEDGQAAIASLDFDVPADLDPSGRITVLGIICPDGSPSADGASCDGADPGTPVTLELELAHTDDVNTNPELQPDSIVFDGDVWPDLPAVDGDCTALGFPEVEVRSKHMITVELDASDRDPLPHPDVLDPKRESLQLSHFATAGDLTRAFETIAWDSDQLSREVSWTAPKEPGLVRFWLVLRDFRGGSAFVERAVCVW